MNTVLSSVLDEDHALVQSCVSVLEKIKPDKIFTTWTCRKSTAPAGFYIVTAYINSDRDFDFSTRELEVVYEVSPARVVAVTAGRTGSVCHIEIKISDKNQPIVLNDVQITHIRKRSRWGMIK